MCVRICGNCVWHLYAHTYKSMHVFRVYMKMRGTAWERGGGGQRSPKTFDLARQIQEGSVCLFRNIPQLEHLRVCTQSFLTALFFTFRCLLKELCTFTPISRPSYISFPPPQFPYQSAAPSQSPRSCSFSAESAGFSFLPSSACCPWCWRVPPVKQKSRTERNPVGSSHLF